MPVLTLVSAVSRVLRAVRAKFSTDAAPTGHGLPPRVAVRAGLLVSALSVVLSAFMAMFGTMADAQSITVVVSDTTLTVGETATVTVESTYFMGILGMNESKLSAEHAVLTNFTQVTYGKKWTATLTPQASFAGTGNKVALAISDLTTGPYTLGEACNCGPTLYSSSYDIDTTAPTVTSVTAPSGGTYGEGQTLTFTAHWSEPVVAVGTPVLYLSIGAGTSYVIDADNPYASYVSGSGTDTWLFKYTVGSGITDDDGITMASGLGNSGGSSMKDLSGNSAGRYPSIGTVPAMPSVLIETVHPTVTSVTVPSDDTYGAGEDLSFTVNWSENVTVTDTPRLALTLGSSTVYATYASGSGSTALVFKYTVQSGDLDADGIVVGSSVGLNSGTINDGAGNSATLTLNSVGSTTGVQVDAAAPTVTSVSVPSNATYGAGQALSFTVNLSEDVTVDTTNGIPRLALTLGSSSVYASYDAGSSTPSALVFKYTVRSGDLDADGIVVGSLDPNNGTITDAASNTATVTLNSVGSTTGVLVEAIAPTVTSVTAPSDGVYTEGQDVLFTVNFSEPVTVSGTPRIKLTVGYSPPYSYANYYSGSGSAALVFKYTVATADSDPNGIAVLTLDQYSGSTIKDAAGNDASRTLNSVGPTTGVRIGRIVTSLDVPSAGTYGAGQALTFTVHWSMAAYVTGTPWLNLDIGAGTSYANETAQATYVSGTGTDTWVFQYTVEANKTDSDGIATDDRITNSDGGSMKNLNGDRFDRLFGSIPSVASVFVETVAPTVTSVTVPSDDTYGVGEDLSFTVNWSENVTVTGTPRLGLTIGSNSGLFANYDAASSTASELVFKYTVQTGDVDDDGIVVGSLEQNSGSTIKDAANNDATLTLNSVGSTTGVLVDAVAADTTGPTIYGVYAQTANGTYEAGDQILIAVAFDENVTVTGTPQITLETGATDRVASYTSGSGSQVLRFTYTVQAGDASADLDYISTAALALNGGTIKDAALNDATLTLPALGVGSLAVTYDLVIDARPDATPATEFAAKADVIRQTLTDDAARGLASTILANQSLAQDAKARFVSGSDQTVTMNVDGSFDANPVSLSTMGTFYGQSVNGTGARRVIFGTFDVQRDGDTGTSTATVNGKIAWEQTTSDTTVIGYFIGGDLAKSNIAGSFSGDQNHIGLSLGAYGVHEMSKHLYLEGFVSLGAGRNNLAMADDVLALESGYTTRSASAGGSLSGVIAAKGFEIWPELALSVGRTWIGAVDFTGAAYDLTDDTLSLDAGMITLANLTFRPEFRVPLDGLTTAQSQHLLTLAPRFICQQLTSDTTANSCGGGAEIGLQTHSADGMTSGTAQVKSDWINGQTSTIAQLNIEHRF